MFCHLWSRIFDHFIHSSCHGHPSVPPRILSCTYKCESFIFIKWVSHVISSAIYTTCMPFHFSFIPYSFYLHSLFMLSYLYLDNKRTQQLFLRHSDLIKFKIYSHHPVILIFNPTFLNFGKQSNAVLFYLDVSPHEAKQCAIIDEQMNLFVLSALFLFRCDMNVDG